MPKHQVRLWLSDLPSCQQLRKKVLFYFQKLSSFPVTQIRRKSLQVLRFSHHLVRLFIKKLKKFHKKNIFSIILLAIIQNANRHQFSALAELSRFSHFLQQINKSVPYPFSKIQTRAPSLFPFVRCWNLHKSGSWGKFEWELGKVTEWLTCILGIIFFCCCCLTWLPGMVPGTIAKETVLPGFCGRRERVLSDLPTHIWSEFSIYGDLGNERTEIDSELAFGFLKMGVTPIY